MQQSHGIVNVQHQGVLGNGTSLQTKALQHLIDQCAERGGGCLYFPPGIYLTGSLFLRSHIRLYLENGCVIKASGDRGDYEALPPPHRCEGRDTALLCAIDAVGISIDGDGVFDGSHEAFFDMETPVVEADYDPARVRQGKAFAEKPNGMEDGPATPLRDKNGQELRYGTMLLFIRCEDLSFRNFRIIHSPNWCLHLAGCRRVVITGLNIRNSLLVPNADCLDISNSQNVTVTHCLLEGGDDGIALSPCADGYAMAPTRNIVVSNCSITSRSCGIRVGYGIERLSDCVFSNLIICNTNRAIGLFVRNRQILENLLFTNILIETRLHTGWWGASEPIHISVVPGYTDDVSTGFIRNVRFSQIHARAENGILMYGADCESERMFPIQDITLEHITLHILPSSLNARHGGNIDLRPAHDAALKLFSSDLAALYARNVKGLTISDFQLRWPEGEPSQTPEFFRHAIRLEGCEDFKITDFEGKPPPSSPDNDAVSFVESP